MRARQSEQYFYLQKMRKYQRKLLRLQQLMSMAGGGISDAADSGRVDITEDTDNLIRDNQIQLFTQEMKTDSPYRWSIHEDRDDPYHIFIQITGVNTHEIEVFYPDYDAPPSSVQIKSDFDLADEYFPDAQDDDYLSNLVHALEKSADAL